MTGSGPASMLINPRERALSTDINRAQAFGGRALSDFLRAFLLANSVDDIYASGVESYDDSAAVTPLPAAVLAGVRFRPEIGTVNAFVEAGTLIADWPESPQSVDDSRVKLITDPGVQTAGELVLTPNASGSTRVDIIECQPVFVVDETDNRDIFDPSTGLFSAVSVDKVRQYRLTYRIRTGTAGAGFPGLQVGWLPIAVASVPTGSTTWDDVDHLWDVRPLLADRVNGPSSDPRLVARMVRNILFFDTFSGAGVFNMSGTLETDASRFKLGGAVNPLSPYTLDLNGLTNPDILDPGFAVVNNIPYYIYLMTPFGLPRWAKYSPSSSGARKPYGPRGLYVISNAIPLVNVGIPSTPIGIPSSLGFGVVSSSEAVCVAAGPMNSGTLYGLHSAGRMIQFQVAGRLAYAPAVNTTSLSEFNLVAGISHPPTARTVRVRFVAQFSSALALTNVPITNIIGLYDPLFSNLYWDAKGPVSYVTQAAVLTTRDAYFEVDIPVVNATTYGVRWTYTGHADLGIPTVEMQVIGWDLGP
jgi:hypothetical protein